MYQGPKSELWSPSTGTPKKPLGFWKKILMLKKNLVQLNQTNVI